MMISPFGLSRRDCIRVLLAAIAGRAVASPTFTGVTPVERLLQEHGTEPVRTVQKNFRAHAYIHLLAIPLLSRQDAGGGYAIAGEARDDDESMIKLEFAGGSHPDRTRGLNRVGYIQEAIYENKGFPAESAYYGFMISSGEKSLNEARGSLATDTAGSIPYSAAVGTGRPGKFDCAVSHIPMPARYNWASFEQLRDAIRAVVLTATDTKHCEVALDRSESAPNTFLYSVRAAILAKQSRMKIPIVYNGKRFELSTDKQPDERIGQQLVARKVVAHANRIVRLNGSILERATRQSSTFQIWFEQDEPSGLPVRIEFYPKSFLRLVFEQDATLPQQTTNSVAA